MFGTTEYRGDKTIGGDGGSGEDGTDGSKGGGDNTGEDGKEMKSKEVRQHAKELAEEFDEASLNYLRAFLYADARGHKNGKTREEVFVHMKGIGYDIEDKDGRKLRNMLEELVRLGYPCFTSPTFGHYYAQTMEDVDLCVRVRMSMIHGHKKYCQQAGKAWKRELVRMSGGRDGE